MRTIKLDKNSQVVKYYYRISISRKDIPDLPIFEIAGFMNFNIAMNYVNNIVKKHKGWDENTMQVIIATVALPPMTDEDDTLAAKIGMLSRMTRE